MSSLNLVSLQAGSIQPPELILEPSLTELQLQGRQDDQRLMIALGETLNCSRPINPMGISRHEDLLLVWLGPCEVMAIVNPRFGYDLEGALRSALGAGVEVELIPDTSLQLTVSVTIWQHLLSFEQQPINSGFLKIQPTDLCVRPSTACCELRLLLQQQDQQLLQRWIRQLCH